MLLFGQNGHTPFFWNLPVWSPDYAIFFGVLYLVPLVLGCGLGIVFMRSLREAACDTGKEHHAGH